MRDLSVVEPISDIPGDRPAPALQEQDLYTFQSNNLYLTQEKTGEFSSSLKDLGTYNFRVLL